jgi:hypothetical protein
MIALKDSCISGNIRSRPRHFFIFTHSLMELSTF